MIGIVFGLGAAALQSLSYLFSRAFLRRSGQSPWILLVVAHAIMGLAALMLLPWAYVPGAHLNGAVAGWALSASGFYLAGQLAWFHALQHMDSSRVAPLLGAKILLLALLTVAGGGGWLSAAQWGAVLLAAGGVFVLNQTGGRLPARGLLAVAGAILGYSLSDLSIVRLVRATGLDNWRGAFFGAMLSYLVCGLALAPWLVRQRAARAPSTWRAALPFAVCWLLAMILLYACFASIGAVFGNIVQSMRGLFSIGLGVLLARLGWTDIERRSGTTLIFKRLAGALAMTLAIALYFRG